MRSCPSRDTVGLTTADVHTIKPHFSNHLKDISLHWYLFYNLIYIEYFHLIHFTYNLYNHGYGTIMEDGCFYIFAIKKVRAPALLNNDQFF